MKGVCDMSLQSDSIIRAHSFNLIALFVIHFVVWGRPTLLSHL